MSSVIIIINNSRYNYCSPHCSDVLDVFLRANVAIGDLYSSVSRCVHVITWDLFDSSPYLEERQTVGERSLQIYF